MAKFKLTNKAVKDLSEIWNYTVDIWSEKQAEKYYILLIDSCSEIAHNPEKGKEYTEIHSHLKGVKMSKHIIFYRIMEIGTIEITRILHESMDIKNNLKI
jgi:toxin ParE1/3/4